MGVSRQKYYRLSLLCVIFVSIFWSSDKVNCAYVWEVQPPTTRTSHNTPFSLFDSVFCLCYFNPVNKNLLISLLVVILLLAGGYWLYRQGGGAPNGKGAMTMVERFDPRKIKVGDKIDVFTVESVETDLLGEGYTIRLKGEKILVARFYIGDPFDTGTVVHFYIDEAGRERAAFEGWREYLGKF